MSERSIPHHGQGTSDVLPSIPTADLRFLKGDLFERAIAITRELAVTASRRDREGGTAKAERDLLRRSGLLGAIIPAELGGLGASWSEVLDMVRLFARVDGSLAHLFGFQHLLLASARLFGSRTQWQRLHRETATNDWFWGNALNPLDPSTTISAVGSVFEVNGRKSFSSGSVDADQLLISAVDSVTGKLVVAAIPSDRKGLAILGDWDNMGQRQTDSGTVEFHHVPIERAEIFSDPGPLGNTYATLRPLIAQLTLTNLYVGIAEGAVHAARKYTLTSRRAWPQSTAACPAEDPLVLRRYGEFAVAVAGAGALADRAALSLDEDYASENALSPERRGATAIEIATAKVAATRAVLEVTSEIFDVTGARATASSVNLDRFWRNARTHTLHDPVDYKLIELGSHTLNSALPNPSFFS